MFFGENHFGKYTLIKNIIAKSITLAVSAVVGFALVLFVNNAFPFLPQVQLHDYSQKTTSDDIDNIVPNFPDENPIDDINNSPENDIVHAPSASDFIEKCTQFDEVARNNGYYISDLQYNGTEFKIMRLSPEIEIPNYYSVSNYSETSSPRPALQPRMGFIVMQKSDLSFALLDADGSFLCDIPENMALISARDSQGNPIFASPDGYFFYYREDSAFISSNYNPILDVHGAVFDFPSYYDAPTESVYRVHGDTAGSWGYRHEDGRQIVSGIYNFAYQFSQGYGAVSTTNGRISIHNVNGYRRFTDHSFYMPEYNGISSLGFYTFDHGLMRVREAKYDWRGNKTYDREFVIHLGNNEFFIPQDYKIESYFDGVFLLSKNGKYGYFNYLGEWICQPVYTYASPFVEGLGVIGYADGKKGVVDENGDFVVPLLFDEITQCSGGVITLYNQDEGWYILTKVTSDLPQNIEPSPEVIESDVYSSALEKILFASSITPSYIAEQAAYDYTVWSYFNPAPTVNVSPIEALSSMTFIPSYIAERAAYDYTVWSYYNNEQSALERTINSMSFFPSYTAEQAAYNYTLWLFKSSPIDNAFMNLPFATSYIAENAAYNYTLWLYNITPLDNALSNVPFGISYVAEKAAYDYTLWLYGIQP